MFYLHKPVFPLDFRLALHHVVVSGKQAAGVDAKVWAVTFSPSPIPLACHSEDTTQFIYSLINCQLRNLLFTCDTTLLLHHEGDCRHLRPSDRSRSPMTKVFVDRRHGTSLLNNSADQRSALYHTAKI